MSIPELCLFEGCQARLPQIIINRDMTVEEAREYTKPLLVLATACNGLREDWKSLWSVVHTTIKVCENHLIIHTAWVRRYHDSKRF
jgi:hypothetical protein